MESVRGQVAAKGGERGRKQVERRIFRAIKVFCFTL